MTSVPQKMKAWPLFGAGMDKLGKNDAACVVDTPAIKEDELLVRIDAIGLCFSDIKLIKAGEHHPRVISKNLDIDPVIPGHEAVMTVLQVGSKADSKFKPGQRFIIQADIYVKGVGYAYGYAIDGGMAEYSRVDQRVLNGDEGCYLLPLADSIPSGIAALIEPWTCVIASYRIANRSEPLKGGRVLIAGAEGKPFDYEFGALFTANPPAEAVIAGFDSAAAAKAAAALPGTKVSAAKLSEPQGEFDDVFLCGIQCKTCAERLAAMGSKNAVVSLIGDYPDALWSFDVGKIHYNGWFYQGSTGGNLSAAYGRNVRSELRPGGSCWLLGGAGAMGQMHTQLAVESANGPKRVLVTDMDDARLEKVRQLLQPKADARGVEFKLLNPKSFASNAEFEAAVRAFAPAGFDDIVMLVPVVPVLEAADKFLAPDGLMNIFAGIPAGKTGLLNVAGIVAKGHRFIGSSGSKTSDLRHTLGMVERNDVNPATALAAVGGMAALKQGLVAVETAKFPGKTVIYPHCPDLPLTPVEDLSKLIPGIEKTFSASGLFTQETEAAIIKRFGATTVK